MEIRKEVKEYEVDMTCDKCKKGVMRPTGIVLTSYPAQYEHVCTNCGEKELYEVTYPVREIVRVDEQK